MFCPVCFTQLIRFSGRLLYFDGAIAIYWQLSTSTTVAGQASLLSLDFFNADYQAAIQRLGSNLKAFAFLVVLLHWVATLPPGLRLFMLHTFSLDLVVELYIHQGDPGSLVFLVINVEPFLIQPFCGTLH
jgi:hypothetical protein